MPLLTAPVNDHDGRDVRDFDYSRAFRSSWSSSVVAIVAEDFVNLSLRCPWQ